MALARRDRLGLFVLLASIAMMGLLDARHPAAAWSQAAPWCANLGGSFGSYDCSYYTFEQCMATARGLGNSCAPNPRALYEPLPPRRRVRR